MRLSASKGRCLAWYVGPSPAGVSEPDPGAGALGLWAGTQRLAGQMATHRPREDLTEGTASWWAQPVAAGCGPGGCAAWDAVCPAPLPVPSFRAALPSVCGRQRCTRAKLQTVRAPLNSRPTGGKRLPAVSFDPC